MDTVAIHDQHGEVLGTLHVTARVDDEDGNRYVTMAVVAEVASSGQRALLRSNIIGTLLEGEPVKS